MIIQPPLSSQPMKGIIEWQVQAEEQADVLKLLNKITNVETNLIGR